MSRNPHTTTARPDDPPVAIRARSLGWRDPRLWVGVVLVAGSVVLGARVLSTADEHTTVWAASHDLAPGVVLDEDDLVPSQVRFVEEGDAAHYVGTGETLPEELHLTRAVSAGELVPVAALSSPEDADLVRVSISLAAEDVAPDLAAGSRVDVWVVGEDRRGDPTATQVLQDVAVVDVPTDEGAWGSSALGRQVVLAVPESDTQALASVLAAGGDGRVRIVARN